MALVFCASFVETCWPQQVKCFSIFNNAQQKFVGLLTFHDDSTGMINAAYATLGHLQHPTFFLALSAFSLQSLHLGHKMLNLCLLSDMIAYHSLEHRPSSVEEYFAAKSSPGTQYLQLIFYLYHHCPPLPVQCN
jgi:hypothetical protein